MFEKIKRHIFKICLVYSIFVCIYSFIFYIFFNRLTAQIDIGELPFPHSFIFGNTHYIAALQNIIFVAYTAPVIFFIHLARKSKKILKWYSIPVVFFVSAIIHIFLGEFF